MQSLSTALLLGLASLTATTAFLLPSPTAPVTGAATASHRAAAAAARGGHMRMLDGVPSSSRRGLLENAGKMGLLTLGLVGGVRLAPASAAGSDDAPIAVLGARGKTGRLIVKDLLALGKRVRAVSYQPFAFGDKDGVAGTDAEKALLEYAVGDVTKPDTLPAAIRGAGAVIFASSASRKGGNAEAVDFKGVENIARACIDEKTPRLLVVSSGAVSRPDSLGYKVTNIFGGIMGYKFQGEEALRKLYASSAPKGVTYTIVRPGGLSNDAGLGVSGIELNQKDTIIGEISRADVAATCVNALFAPDAADATFEVYEIRRRTTLQPEFKSESGFERRGSDWPALFKGLKKDSELAA